jgi:hypothetical protein
LPKENIGRSYQRSCFTAMAILPFIRATVSAFWPI